MTQVTQECVGVHEFARQVGAAPAFPVIARFASRATAMQRTVA